jgi:two-component system, NarL family, sensor kinase
LGVAGGQLAVPLARKDSEEIEPRRRVPDGFVVSVVVSVVTLVVLEITAIVLIDRLAERSALDHAGAIAAEAANVALAPYLTDELLLGDPRAVDALGRAGDALVSGDDVVHLKVWDARGRVVWADEPHLVGRRFELGETERALLGTHDWVADVSELDDPENAFDGTGGNDRLLEVYFATRTLGGEPVLVEVYAPDALLSQRADDLRGSFLPLMTMALISLAVGQIALVWTLGRRLARAERREARLLRRLIERSDAERRRVAAEVHDGVVQELAGISFQLAAIGGTASPDPAEVRRMADATQDAVASLRGLLSSIYPVTVPVAGWVTGLDDLVGGLRRLGVTVTIDVANDKLNQMEQLLLLRVTREALRNVAAHAEASHVAIALVERDGRLTLTIADDGQGFDPTTDVDGHFGLKLVRDLVDDAGGTFEAASEPGRGTTLRCDLAVTR